MSTSIRFAERPAPSADLALEPRLWRYVVARSWRRQLGLLALSIAMLPLSWLSLEIPKRIVNDALLGPPGDRTLFGAALDREGFLLALTAIFLLVVCASNLLKHKLNTGLARSGERLLAELRRVCFSRALRAPLPRMSRERPADLTQRLMAELEPLGGFMAGVIVEPALQFGLLAVYAGFVFAQSAWLGLAAVAMFPLQGWLVPRLQRRLRLLNRERAARARTVAACAADAVGSLPEMRLGARTGAYETRMETLLGRLSETRAAIFERKYLVKGVNNVINQLAPAAFYGAGGLMALRGDIQIGTLIAVIAAQRELLQPWRALLTYVQQAGEFGARYAHAVESFPPIATAPATPQRPSGPLRLAAPQPLPAHDGLRAVAMVLPPGADVAVTGSEPHVAGFLGLAAGLIGAQGVVCRLGDFELGALDVESAAACVGWAPARPEHFECAAADALGGGSDADVVARARRWGLAEEIAALALDHPAPPGTAADWARLGGQVKAAVAATLGEDGLDDLVARMRPGRIDRDVSLAMFLGLEGLSPRALRAALRCEDGIAPLAAIGAALAREARELVAAAGASSELLESGSEGGGVDLAAAARLGGGRDSARRRMALAQLALTLVPERDRLADISERAEADLSALRDRLARAGLAAAPSPPKLVELLCGGRPRRTRLPARPRLDAAIRAAVEAQGASEALLRAGLAAPLGRDTAPSLLRRLALARAAARRPAVLVVERAAAATDPEWRARARAEAPEAILIWAAEAAPRDAWRVTIAADGLAVLEEKP
jgi:putative ABC transport system ATP-binding protein